MRAVIFLCENKNKERTKNRTVIPSAGFFCKSLICFTMAFTVADERCSISSFLFYKGVLLFQTKSDFLEPTNTTTPLSVFAQEKRNARQAPSTKRRKRCVAVVRRERSFFRVSERCFFSQIRLIVRRRKLRLHSSCL